MFNTERIDHIYEDPHVENRHFKLHYGDLTDSMNLTRIIQEIQPDEIYNLAAMSHVAVSFETPEYTGNADGLGTLRNSGSRSFTWTDSKDKDLSGIDFRIIWNGARGSANRENTFLSTFAICCSQIICLLDHGKLFARLIRCMPAMVFCLITSRLFAVKPL